VPRPYPTKARGLVGGAKTHRAQARLKMLGSIRKCIQEEEMSLDGFRKG
jgi:hypothetical protein